ncbi:hypothetical protein LTR27_001397 [Elasticomyces elasticus]|nr:hypothetical protein LTR27_001397 [Elasticomyces elasticus]
MFESMEHDSLVDEFRTHTEEMAIRLDTVWYLRWAELGEAVPEEQYTQHTYTTDEAEMEAKAMEEVLVAETEALALGRDLINRGGSPETEALPGGAEAPWLKAPETAQNETEQREPAQTLVPQEMHSPPSPPPLPVSPPESPSVPSHHKPSPSPSPEPSYQPSVEEESDEDML